MEARETLRLFADWGAIHVLLWEEIARADRRPRPDSKGNLAVRCPVHGGDHQHSLRVRLADGFAHCFVETCPWSLPNGGAYVVGIPSSLSQDAARAATAHAEEIQRDPLHWVRSMNLANVTGPDHPAATYLSKRGFPWAAVRALAAETTWAPTYSPWYQGGPRAVFFTSHGARTTGATCRLLAPAGDSPPWVVTEGWKGTFGLSLVRRQRPRRLFIVESALDAWAMVVLSEAGVLRGGPTLAERNVVATCGTMSPSQVRELAYGGHYVTLALDADFYLSKDGEPPVTEVWAQSFRDAGATADILPLAYLQGADDPADLLARPDMQAVVGRRFGA